MTSHLKTWNSVYALSLKLKKIPYKLKTKCKHQTIQIQEENLGKYVKILKQGRYF